MTDVQIAVQSGELGILVKLLKSGWFCAKFIRGLGLADGSFER
jgi:hypothetical protein